MGRRALSIAAIGLWLCAGAAFALFGVRSMRLEREAAQRGVQRLDIATVEGAVRLLPTIVSELLEHEPTERFFAAAEQTFGGPGALATDEFLGIAQAAYLERSGSARAAEAMLVDVAAREQAVVTRFTAEVRAGTLALRRGDRTSAEPHLRAAAAIDPRWLDPDGFSIARLALRQLAPADAAIGDARALLALLDASSDGAVVRLDDRIHASDLLVAAAGDAGMTLDHVPGGVRERLAAAVARTRRGHRYVAATASRGVAVVGDTIAYRPVAPGPAIVTTTIDRVQASLRAKMGDGLSVTRSGSANDEFTRLAAPPFQTLAVATRNRLETVRTPIGTVTIWALGLGLYLVAGLAAILWFVRNARASRMQADFVAAVSHEMKTPIAGIQAMAEMLADGRVADPARAHTYAERIRAEASRLGAGVRNVLDAARIERDPSSVVRPRPTEPSALVLDLATVLRPVLEGRGFRFTVTATPSPRPIPIDPDAFGSVVGNLLDNAAKFSSETKEIEVDAGPVAHGYRVSVADRGPGVPEHERAKVFERFTRGEHARRMAVPGVGLGLHVARNLVKAHRGTIEVHPREGGGAVFVVEWPEDAQ